MTKEELLKALVESGNTAGIAEFVKALMQEVESIKLGPAVPVSGKKNQAERKATPGRKYVRLSDDLGSFGNIPQQQKDIANMLKENMVIGEEYTEDEVFFFLNDQYEDYPQLKRSVQTVTYLFAYYRGLKKDLDKKHAGFIARNFLRQIN